MALGSLRREDPEGHVALGVQSDHGSKSHEDQRDHVGQYRPAHAALLRLGVQSGLADLLSQLFPSDQPGLEPQQVPSYR